MASSLSWAVQSPPKLSRKLLIMVKTRQFENLSPPATLVECSVCVRGSLRSPHSSHRQVYILPIPSIPYVAHDYIVANSRNRRDFCEDLVQSLYFKDELKEAQSLGNV